MNINEIFLEAQKIILGKKIGDAKKLLLNCISINDNFDPAYLELVKLYIFEKKEDKAVQLLENAIHKNPQNIIYYTILSEIYLHNHLKNPDKAINICEKLLSMGYTNAETFYSLSGLYHQVFDNDKARYYIEKAYEANKINPRGLNIDFQYKIIGAILADFNYQKIDNFYPLYYKKLISMDELRFDFANRYKSWNNFSNKKIKLGFVTGDFSNHPVKFFSKPLIANLDRNKYELFAYSTTDYEDKDTKDIKKYFDKWSIVNTAQSKTSAEIIHNDNIDILFDLSGHSLKNGLILFKYRPAPIQVSWLGYFASTGISEMDYYITSKPCFNEVEQQYFTEKVLTLPETYHSYDYDDYDIDQEIMPYDKNGYITYGFFQNLSKIFDADIEMWNKILISSPTSKLIIKSSELSQEEIKNKFLKKISHLPLDRISLRGRTDLIDHIKNHNDVDIMLDGCHVGGATTTCQSLYMGVPILSIKGDSALTRHGVQFLNTLKLNQFIASDEQDLINKTKNVDISELREIKQNLRNLVMESPIGNSKLFASHFEKIIENSLIPKLDKKLNQ